MHYEGVPWIGIESATSRLQPLWHAAVDIDENNFLWLMMDRLSMWDTYVLFLQIVSKIVNRRSNKNVRQNPIVPKLLHILDMWLLGVCYKMTLTISYHVTMSDNDKAARHIATMGISKNREKIVKKEKEEKKLSVF